MDIQYLEKKAAELRKLVIESLYNAGSGHTGGSLGLADIFTSLFFHILKHDSNNPLWENRDKLYLSIGHVAPIYYTSLAASGYFDIDELKTLRKLGSRLQGHPGRDHQLPGIELSAGSLGQGLSVAVGAALASKYKNLNNYTFCICGDGELQEGSIWEAIMSAAHYKLNKLIAIVDRNGLQIDGKTEDVMSIEPLEDKWKAFGWNVINCDGNNIQEFISACDMAKLSSDKPSVIIAKTIMGKGINEIENNHKWHGKAPNKEEYIRFINVLNQE